MIRSRFPWSDGTWTVPPRTVTNEGEALTVEAVEGSDYWERTLYGFQHRDGHALLAPWPASNAVEVSFRLDAECFTGLYDQAGLMLWNGPERWIKAGVEITDGVPHLGAVVTDGYSDWSLAPVPEWMGSVVTVRASRMNDGVILRARAQAGDGAWRTLRVTRFDFDDPGGTQAGPFLCAPTRAGFRATFTSWITTDADTDLHAAPPA